MRTGFTLLHNTDVRLFELVQHDSVIHCDIKMGLNIGSTILQVPGVMILQNFIFVLFQIFSTIIKHTCDPHHKTTKKSPDMDF